MALYKTLGADGKEYGPVSAEQLQRWLAEGRLNAQSRVRTEGETEWKSIRDVPELNALLSATASPGTAAPVMAGLPTETLSQEKGLAIASFILGILSMVCFGLLAGIPAIICGHIARGRWQRDPVRHGGEGFALAGLILGYVSIVISFLIVPAMLLPALSRAKSRAQSINCINNMKQIGLAYRVWALDHEDQFPSNVSTNKGGTMELVSISPDGFDKNGWRQFQVLSNELGNAKILVCGADTSKAAAFNFQMLQSANVSYQVHAGTNYSADTPQAILAICPIHGHKLLCDGSVQYGPKTRR